MNSLLDSDSVSSISDSESLEESSSDTEMDQLNVSEPPRLSETGSNTGLASLFTNGTMCWMKKMTLQFPAILKMRVMKV